MTKKERDSLLLTVLSKAGIIDKGYTGLIEISIGPGPGIRYIKKEFKVQ